MCKKADDYPKVQWIRPIRPFEAADLIAYEYFRINSRLANGDGRAFIDELRKPAQRLIKLNGSETWGIVERHQMAQLCELCKVPRRSQRLPSVVSKPA